MSRLHGEHTPEAIAARLDRGESHSYLRDFVYGAIDGAVTTFAVVAGVVGAQLDSAIVVVLGIANLIADGFSMAASNFLATRAEQQQFDLARQTEYQQVQEVPEGEREEVRQLLAARGFEGHQLEAAVAVITADPDRWVDMMMQVELGLPRQVASAWRAGLATFAAFLVVGTVPLLAYVYAEVIGDLSEPFVLSSVLTGLAFFTVGAVKSRFVLQSWWRSGLETLAVGGAAATLAYVAGVLLRGLVD